MNRPRTIAPLLYALLLALPSLLLAGPLLRGAIPYFMDTAMYFFPLRVQAARVLAAGEWPLWNRALAGGMPLLENPQAALAYPLNWPSLIWPGGFWFTFPLTLQLGLCAALTAWALGRAGAGRWPALWAGALVLAGNYGWSRLQFGNYMNVLPWWPLWLGAAHAWSATGHRRWPVAGAAAVALMLLAGAHQLAAYGLAALGGYALWMAAGGGADRRRWLQYLGLTFGLGALIGAPGWLPALAFLHETSRAEGLAADRVLAGALGSWGELARALLGDWRAMGWRPGPPWGDAEGSAALGLVALTLAAVPPRRRALRRIWLGCWLLAAITLALAARPVVAALLHWTPLAAMFHDPRRWLGATQWLLTLAAGLGVDALWTGWPGRRRWTGGMMALALALIGHVTWVTTDLAMLPARALTHPDPAPLIAQAGLAAGERFYSLDWQTATSYDYRRPDLTAWALPNLAMLWGVEDLGAYEPALTARYRAYLAPLQGGTPWRQLAPGHFGLVTAPWARAALEAGNVRAAILPRWGFPFYLRPVTLGGRAMQGALLPNGWTVPLRVVLATVDGAAGGRQARLAGAEGQGAAVLEGGGAIGPAEDLALTSGALPLGRMSPPAAVRSLTGTLAPQPPRPGGQFWALEPDGGLGRIVDAYGWDGTLAALYRPLGADRIAALFAYEGPSRRTVWETGRGRMLEEVVHHNRLELTVQVDAAPARLVIHDAWWPGWQARLAGGERIEVQPAGLWRAVEVPAGRHTLTLRYAPPRVRDALALALLGMVGAGWFGLRGRKPRMEN